MIKKALLLSGVVLSGVFGGVSVSYAEFGVSLNLGTQKADGDDLKKNEAYFKDGGWADPISATTDLGSFVGGVDFFYERPFGTDWSWGASVGYAGLSSGEQKMTFTTLNPGDSRVSVKNSAVEFPVTAYARKQMGKMFSLRGGAGFTFLQAKTEYSETVPSWSTSIEAKDNKVAPLLVIGADYHPTPMVTLGLSLRQTFSAKLDDFKGNGSETGQPSGEYRLSMFRDPNGTEGLAGTQGAVSSGERGYEVDYSGLRVSLTASLRFGVKND